MGQQWTRALGDLRHFQSTGHQPASVNAIGAAKPRVQILEKDVLALCEDGDLLLMREQVANAGLRVIMDPVVARDISRMQHGQFPAQRVTGLPVPGNLYPAGVNSSARVLESCALLLRLSGLLHVLEVTVDGILLTPFSGRIAATKNSRLHPRNRYAIRRLQHVKSYESSESLRSLVYEIASLLPLQWQQLQPCAANAGADATTSSGTAIRDSPTTTGPEKQLTPVLSQLLREMLKVFHRSLELGASRDYEASNASPTTHEPDLNTPSSNEPTVSSAPDGDPFSLGRLLQHGEQTLERVDVNAILSTALVAVVYEYIGVVKPIDLASIVQPLSPTAFWTGNADHRVLVFNDSNALGDEMYLQQRTHK